MTDIMEARRKGFEEWILSSFMSDGDRDLVLRDEFGEYYSVGVAERWEMYNAVLDSVCVELPGPMPSDDPYASYEGGWNDMRSEAQDALAASGVRYK